MGDEMRMWANLARDFVVFLLVATILASGTQPFMQHVEGAQNLDMDLNWDPTMSSINLCQSWFKWNGPLLQAAAYLWPDFNLWLVIESLWSIMHQCSTNFLFEE